MFKSTTPTKRVATEGMADQAAPVLKSTWPPRPVATAGDADQAAPVLHADQAHTIAVPALSMFLPRIHTRVVHARMGGTS